MAAGSRITRRALLAGGIGSIAGAALAEGPLRSLRPMARSGAAPAISTGPVVTDLRPQARLSLAGIIEEARLSGATSVAVADSNTGRILDAHADTLRLPPASVTKALTTLYAIDALGADHRFATRLIGTGPINGGVLEGDLVLSGGGDPTLTTDDLGAMAQALRDAGVAQVQGAFRVWGGAIEGRREIDPQQLPHLGYNPAVSGLNLNFNRVHFEWARQGGDWRVTMDARASQYRPEVRSSRMTVADRSTPVYTYRDVEGVDTWTVASGALGTGGSRWLPVRNPALYAGEVLRVLALAQGLDLPEPQVQDTAPEGATLAEHMSQPLAPMLEEMLLYSTNLTAECIGLAASAARAGVPQGQAASAGMMNDWLREVFGAEARFVDHSGLGQASRISAAQMVTILATDRAKRDLRPLLKYITLIDGQGEALATPPGIVQAKTGTLNFVSALAGYERTRDGVDLAFAIFSGDPERRQAAYEAGDEIPEGARGWNGRAKWMQQRLLQRWGFAFSQRAAEIEDAAQGASLVDLPADPPAALLEDDSDLRGGD
ncbi:D-alanyl-D-alanine carboxypeptidase/D-alanyl-D-alanine endopeptidase [Pseudoroseicyclus aestuarii]|uniref:D-alanyl-D-alanine carboxypeptidase/D-alanyl-D-alanine endopeptidase n=1 Tax=Pseudoroseicyclus aestuarii TaxID=1795041 RepID=UPI001FE8E889|nr:D-alanyl-D-alanine carboxypeptidase/D-alanyl-D-alanine-endopeptidase [Pseudoroseicyclus aestuarii]